MASDARSPVLGFLTVVEHEQGFTGGYLILNLAGRPLEFHLTAPVKTNRAQQILYGPTLQPYLYGEQIGQTLLGKGSLEPLAVCTNLEAALAVRDHVELPVALVISPTIAAAVSELQTPHLLSFSLGRNQLAVPLSRERDKAALVERLEKLTAFDMSEPFERIREAIEEAHRGRAAA